MPPNPPPAAPSAAAEPPLAVDLDGTLIRTDMLWESFVAVLREKPWVLLQAPLWWTRGRACLKQELARRVALDPALLPVHEGFLAWLHTERARGRRLVLATASDQRLADLVGRHFQIFTAILGSDGRANLRGDTKARELTRQFGLRGFDYAGNSSVDLGVWPATRQAVVVNAPATLPARAAKVTQLGPVFPRPRPELPALLRALLPRRWPVDLLVLAPLLLLPPGRAVAQPLGLALAGGAFLLLSAASGVLQALLDLPADRADRRRASAPFAAGDAPLSLGLAAIPLLLLLALGLGALAAAPVAGLVAAALVVEGLRLFWLRRFFGPDVVARVWLAGTRLAAGVLLAGATLPGGALPWLALAAAAVFAAERRAMVPDRRAWVVAHGCGLLAGPALGWFAATPAARLAFQQPGLLLLLWPALLLWIMRALKTPSDPAAPQRPARDWFRWTLAGAAAAVVWLAARG